jgi:hypothetical protein
MPLLAISNSSANSIYSLSGIVLVVGAVLTLLGTIGAIWSSGIRERFADERIATNEAQTAKANADAAHANEHAAQLEKEAAEAQLKLEDLRRQVAPRQVNREVFLSLIKGQPKAPVELVYLRDDPECFDVAQQIWRLLQDAGWQVSPPSPILDSSTLDPLPMSVDGQPSGVTVVTHSATEQEINGKVITPWTALRDALMHSIGKLSGHAGGHNPPPNGTLRIVVAPR